MALNLIIRPYRTLSHPIVRTEFRSLFTSYYMTNQKNKVGTDHVNQSFSPADYIIDPVPISTSASVPYANPRRFATSVGDESRLLGLGKSIKKTIGHATGLGYRYPKYRMSYASLKLYLCCTELVQFDELFEYLDLPDTYLSYFNLLFLHIWIILSRVAQEGEEGRFVKKSVLTFLWEDMTERTKKLITKGVLKNRHESLGELHGQSTAALFAYDEGSLGDDKMLAGTLWRILFQKDCNDPQKLAKMVHYVRKQQAHLDRQTSESLLYHGIITFLPFEGDTLEYDVSIKQIQRVVMGADGGKSRFVKMIKDPTALRLLRDK